MRAIAEYRKVVTDQPADRSLVDQTRHGLPAAGRTREAVPHLATASAANPKDTILSLQVAALQAWFAQEKELAATRHRILAIREGHQRGETAERAAKACSILPSSNKAEREAALGLGRAAVKLGNGGAMEPDGPRHGRIPQRQRRCSRTALLAAAKAGTDKTAT